MLIAAELVSIIISAQLLIMFLIIINVNTLLLNISVETVMHFSGFFDEQNIQKISIYLKSCVTLINVFTFTFDQFNFFLLNKSINFFIKKILRNYRNLWMVAYTFVSLVIMFV